MGQKWPKIGIFCDFFKKYGKNRKGAWWNEVFLQEQTSLRIDNYRSYSKTHGSMEFF